MLKKVIIILISMFLQSSISFASPIPAFCAAGVLPNCTGKSYSYVRENDASGNAMKYYYLRDSYIRENDASGNIMKYYYLRDSYIRENDASGNTMKYYYFN